MPEPREWPLDDPAAAADLRDWIAEARIDLAGLRAPARDGRMTLVLERNEHDRAAALPSGWLRLLGAQRIPVGRWELSIAGAFESSLEIDATEVVLMVRDISAGPAQLDIRGVTGRFEVRGADLRVHAEFAGESEVEARRVLGFEWFSARTGERA